MALLPVKSKDDDKVTAALVLDYYVPPSLAGRLVSISNAFDDYQKAKRMKGL